MLTCAKIDPMSAAGWPPPVSLSATIAMNSFRRTLIRLEVVEDRVTPAAVFHEPAFEPALHVAMMRTPPLEIVAIDHATGHPLATALHGAALSDRDMGIALPDLRAILVMAFDRPDPSPILIEDLVHHLLAHDHLVALMPNFETDVGVAAIAETAPASAVPVAPIFAPQAAADTVATRFESLPAVTAHGGTLLPAKLAGPSATGAATTSVPDTEPEAAIPSIPSIESPEEPPFEPSIFPRSLPGAALLEQNLKEVESLATTLLSELPATGEVIELFSDPEVYLWAGASVLVISAGAMTVRSRQRVRDRVLLGTASFEAKPRQ